jgi:hypothetical protein
MEHWMKFVNDNYTKEQNDVVASYHSWMIDYYKPLMGAKVLDIAISVDEIDSTIAFLNVKFELEDGSICNTEVISSNDINMPGWIIMLPVSDVGKDNFLPQQ